MSPFEATSSSLIKLAVEALTSAPHYTPAQRQTRAEAVVCAIMAFLPTEPLQIMLASQAVGHHFTLLDTFREINNRALPDDMSVRMRMVASMQTRTTLALLKEFRAVRKERLALAQADQAAARGIGLVGVPAETIPATAQPTDAPADALRVASNPEPVRNAEPLPEADEGTPEEHLEAFKTAYIETLAALEEARDLDPARAARALDMLKKANPSAMIADDEPVMPSYATG